LSQFSSESFSDSEQLSDDESIYSNVREKVERKKPKLKKITISTDNRK